MGKSLQAHMTSWCYACAAAVLLLVATANADCRFSGNVCGGGACTRDYGFPRSGTCESNSGQCRCCSGLPGSPNRECWLTTAESSPLAASDGRVSLVTFDGKPSTTFNFTEQGIPNDEQGKIKSSGTWNVTDGYGALDADVQTEWNTDNMNNSQYDNPGWPGLIRATAEGDFVDASSALGGSLVLEVRSTTPEYAGFKITLATPEKWGPEHDWGCSYEMGPYKNRGCYKASFTVPPSADFVLVQIPLTSFGGAWLYGSGATWPGYNCSESKIPGKWWPHKLPENECLTAKTLADIKQISIWAEGVSGKANLEVRSISAIPAAAIPLQAPTPPGPNTCVDGVCCCQVDSSGPYPYPCKGTCECPNTAPPYHPLPHADCVRKELL